MALAGVALCLLAWPAIGAGPKAPVQESAEQLQLTSHELVRKL
jgi:hypothetical protein